MLIFIILHNPTMSQKATSCQLEYSTLNQYSAHVIYVHDTAVMSRTHFTEIEQCIAERDSLTHRVTTLEKENQLLKSQLKAIRKLTS